ncbi:dienelactone hydrolase family protein [Paraburkholderia phenoliruptrix]|uniref:dienelactone hydrolase family protein n=1 Tax=Paraburkholderia phenoliruptrix TaxID=252970 RepID=UPI001C6F5013|nr:CocE/NonD family hydrolase [Paraburkholderia phenoliruptrix]MBW9104430.1 prolyl oligopeptidase family serine peptidase [Paraburkholderia phenoliruptrix]MBW9129246.1 prolyl oligopeptidase family serine peptidase [Paraburkholderia ginsengiterrae]
MVLSKVLVRWAAICAAATCAVAAAHANPLADGQPGPLARAQVPRIALPDDVYLPSARLNQQIIRIPVDADGEITLQTTIYKPDGAGPFPMIVFNHGKIPGDPRMQERSDPLPLAREFVRRGYVVVAPNRQGFGQSGGVYHQDGCDVERNGMSQAADVAATVDYMSKQPYVDASHIVVAGTSHGGLATMAYGTEAARGVRALINFSGGLRQDACGDWQGNLTRAFGTYGDKTKVPSLWMYGDNDSVWNAPLIASMYAAYVAHGASAKMVDYGTYKNDAHRLVGDRDGVHVWWPAVEAFLARVGMPTGVQYRVEDPSAPKASGFASVDAVDAVPYVDEAGRNGYRNFLRQYPSRAFAVSDTGAWSWAEGGDDPMSVAIANCQKQSSAPCRLYAVDNSVVWGDQNSRTADSGAGSSDRSTLSSADEGRHALASRE